MSIQMLWDQALKQVLDTSICCYGRVLAIRVELQVPEGAVPWNKPNDLIGLFIGNLQANVDSDLHWRYLAGGGQLFCRVRYLWGRLSVPLYFQQVQSSAPRYFVLLCFNGEAYYRLGRLKSRRSESGEPLYASGQQYDASGQGYSLITLIRLAWSQALNVDYEQAENLVKTADKVLYRQRILDPQEISYDQNYSELYEQISRISEQIAGDLAPYIHRFGCSQK